MSMTNLQEIDKVSQRRTFFQALFGGAPDDLYFELRCIHPGELPPRTFWSKIGDKRTLASAFKRAEILNSEGYGVYFAPCLRGSKSGKADAAALLPAFWLDIDCDSEDTSRAEASNRLRHFAMPPSIVLHSGGGLHAYWLLREPAQLDDDEARQRVSAILRGLCEALGGDPQYVKSPASVIRLPGSINTKMKRNGATVTVLEIDPECRYPLEQFAWLEAPTLLKTMNSPVISNGHHPLPPRTEAYLANGAGEGRRNHELFAAACQMRDSGYSQSEAERELVPRHVTNGGSEREALATIRSAYNRPPREPVASPREAVDRLVSHFPNNKSPDRPNAAQIAETVRACATLDPVEWSEVRQQLKSVCGDGLKAADLDRLYREARRNHTRTKVESAESAEHYVERDGCIVYEKENGRGMTRQVVSDWTGRVLEWMMQVDDDGQIDRQMRLQLTHNTHSVTIDAPDELFGDPNGLARFIAGRAGGMFSSRAGMQKHLAPAILKLSGEVPRRQSFRFIGWTRIDDQWIYVSPDVSIGAAGALISPPEVSLESRLRDYGLKEAAWQQGLTAFSAAIAVFPEKLAPTLIAFTFLPVMQRFFPAAASKPALHLAGTTGSGKSEIAALMTSFYGKFTRDTPPSQWGDTVNTVEALGYALADALYWVDDYKASYADEKTFTRFLQSYSRGMGRGRLTREAKLRQERACRGLLLSTGETTIEGEASILSRMLVLEVPPWEQRDPSGTALAQAEQLRDDLPAFTAAFIRWIAEQADAGTLTRRLAERYECSGADYRAQLQNTLGRQANTGRMINNWAALNSVYQLLHEFLAEHGAEKCLPVWQDSIRDTIRAVQQERAGRVFLDLLGQLLAGGQCVIDEPSPSGVSRDHAVGAVIVGYRDSGFVYLLPDLALREINRTHPLRFSKLAIGNQLREDGILIPGKENLTVQKSVRGHVIRVWRMKSESIGCEGCETCETDD